MRDCREPADRIASAVCANKKRQRRGRSTPTASTTNSRQGTPPIIPASDRIDPASTSNGTDYCNFKKGFDGERLQISEAELQQWLPTYLLSGTSAGGSSLDLLAEKLNSSELLMAAGEIRERGITTSLATDGTPRKLRLSCNASKNSLLLKGSSSGSSGGGNHLGEVSDENIMTAASSSIHTARAARAHLLAQNSALKDELMNGAEALTSSRVVGELDEYLRRKHGRKSRPGTAARHHGHSSVPPKGAGNAVMKKRRIMVDVPGDDVEGLLPDTGLYNAKMIRRSDVSKIHGPDAVMDQLLAMDDAVFPFPLRLPEADDCDLTLSLSVGGNSPRDEGCGLFSPPSSCRSVTTKHHGFAHLVCSSSPLAEFPKSDSMAMMDNSLAEGLRLGPQNLDGGHRADDFELLLAVASAEGSNGERNLAAGHAFNPGSAATLPDLDMGLLACNIEVKNVTAAENERVKEWESSTGSNVCMMNSGGA